MKRSVAGFLLYLAFLIWSLPASILDRVANHYSGGIVRLANAEGTLWRGSATLGISNRMVGNYSWKIPPHELFLGRLHVKFDSGMEFVVKPASIELKHAAFDLPASILSLLGKQVGAISPGGMLHVRAEDFLFSKTSSGEVSAQWENASSPLSHVNPLGTYHISVKGAGSTLGVSLATVSGPLNLTGSGAWSEKGGLKFDGVGESKIEGVSELLRVAGPALGGGRYALRLF